MTITVIVASLLVFSWKLLGYLVPERYVTPAVKRFSERVTVALLAALIGIQTLTSSGELVFDVRILAVILAGVLLALRVPFIYVIIAAAALAAALRALGF
ncbi:MAG: AzlD domain-containing protein [Actinobacteria bacterium]|nr:AzlD domain-containing protein [Actinomycetota bacterium]